jgi:hypothetical protein
MGNSFAGKLNIEYYGIPGSVERSDSMVDANLVLQQINR